MLARIILLFCVLFVSVQPSQAGFGSFGRDLAKKVGRNNARGDMADLNGKAKVKILPGYSFFTAEEIAKYESEFGNFTNKDEAGILVPDLGDWFVMFNITEMDYLEGQDKANINADTLMAILRKQMAEDNKDRRAKSQPELRIVGWTHPPAYDAATKKLTYGVRITNNDDVEPEETISYSTHLYGNDNTIVEVMFVADIKGYSRHMLEYKRVVEGVSFGGIGTWGGLSGLAENEKAMLVGAVVMVLVIGLGLVMHKSRPEKRRALPSPRPW